MTHRWHAWHTFGAGAFGGIVLVAIGVAILHFPALPLWFLALVSVSTGYFVALVLGLVGELRRCHHCTPPPQNDDV